MRTVVQETRDAGDVIEIADWRSEFSPAIVRSTPDLPECVSLSREPLWYTARFDFSKRRVMFRVLDHIGIRFHTFEYVFKRPRAKPTLRSWFPGYIFLNFDVQRDRWHQLRRVPGIVQIIEHQSGHIAAIDDEVMEDLLRRCPKNLPLATAETTLKPGTVVRVKTGVFGGQEGVVQSSDRRVAYTTVWMFNRPVVAPIPLTHLIELG